MGKFSLSKTYSSTLDNIAPTNITATSLEINSTDNNNSGTFSETNSTPGANVKLVSYNTQQHNFKTSTIDEIKSVLTTSTVGTAGFKNIKAGTGDPPSNLETGTVYLKYES